MALLLPHSCLEAMAAKAFPSFSDHHHPCLSKLGSTRIILKLSPRASSAATLPFPGTAANVDPVPALQSGEVSPSQSPVSKSSAWVDPVDRNGRLRSPRAARELALCVLYAGIVSDKKPMWIFKERLKQKSGDFNVSLLARYNHFSIDGDSIYVEDAESAKKIEQQQDEESSLEAAVLTAPLPLVYNKFVLKMAEKIILSTVDSWAQQELILKDLLPEKWKARTGGTMLQVCILHMAMAEMVNIGTSSKIVINEAVELAKRFSDGPAARVINGCLGNFIGSPYFQGNQATKNNSTFKTEESVNS